MSSKLLMQQKNMICYILWHVIPIVLHCKTASVRRKQCYACSCIL